MFLRTAGTPAIQKINKVIIEKIAKRKYKGNPLPKIPRS